MRKKKKDYGKLGEIVKKVRERGMSLKDGAEAFGVPAQYLYDYNHWAKKQGGNKVEVDQEEGENEDREQVETSVCSTKEKAIAPQVPAEIQELILQYRGAHGDHGFKKIQDHLKSRHFLVIPRKKIREVLKAHGKLESQDSSWDRKDQVQTAKGTRRFEASYPRELYQMDVTYVYLEGEGVRFLVLVVDDYSRFCVSAQLCSDQKGLTMIEVVQGAIEKYGKPRGLLTDQGSSFYSWSAKQTLFQQYLDDLKIEHLVADPHSPQTLGKVERLNQTVKKELLEKVRFRGEEEAVKGLESYFQGYNYERTHQGIAGARPADRFHGILGESARIETELASKSLDFEKGYLVLRMGERSLSVVATAEGWQVLLDGKLLRGQDAEY